MPIEKKYSTFTIQGIELTLKKDDIAFAINDDKSTSIKNVNNRESFRAFL